MAEQADKALAFQALHAGEPFVVPNPWDVGSARVFEALGFAALATTSSGFAFTLGRVDGRATLGEVAAHVSAIAEATTIPLSVDLENGYAEDAEGVSRAIALVAEAGAVGGSIEDYGPGRGIYELPEALDRLTAAVETARGLPHPFTLTARAENHIRDNPDLGDTITRLRAYEAAGADVLYAPGLRSSEEIRAVCEAVSRPVNVLVLPGMSVADAFAAGARRVSVGGGLAWVALGAVVAAAQELLGEGVMARPATALPLEGWLAG